MLIDVLVHWLLHLLILCSHCCIPSTYGLIEYMLLLFLQCFLGLVETISGGNLLAIVGQALFLLGYLLYSRCFLVISLRLAAPSSLVRLVFDI